jgi:aspartyl-tRNA(Asn)/glutamyl-tRNA(Gln) amidotransferase subunit C
MPEVSASLTRQAAELARLALSEEEVSAFTGQLAQILDYVGQLSEVAVDGVEPMVLPYAGEAPLRADEPRPSPRSADGQPAVLASAPESQDGGFKVPPVL